MWNLDQSELLNPTIKSHIQITYPKMRTRECDFSV